MAQPLIAVDNLHFAYAADSDQPIDALRGVSLRIHTGERVAIVGRNGSGKSTLAKCLNGLLLPGSGSVAVLGMDTADPAHAYDIRAKVGIVLQNPDNQFVATTVEEEIAFGPENLGVPHDALVRRVDDALRTTDLDDQRHREPRALSAGAKARLAVASILAMRPDCLILDESTALLDPLARRELLALLDALRANGLTIIAITHFMDEAALADRVIVMRLGEIVASGAPREVLVDAEALASWGLAPAAATRIAQGLRARGLDVPADVLTMDELVLGIPLVAPHSSVAPVPSCPAMRSGDADLGNSTAPPGEIPGQSGQSLQAGSQTDTVSCCHPADPLGSVPALPQACLGDQMARTEAGGAVSVPRPGSRNDKVTTTCGAGAPRSQGPHLSVAHPEGSQTRSRAVSIRSLAHTYMPGTPLAQPALHDASLSVEAGTIHALVGPSGAGKSTLTHYVNGLERPAQPGRVSVLGRDTADPDLSLAALRQEVALVLQDAHHQLVERFVGDDVAYGPRRLGLDRPALRERVQWAMGAVGLDFDLYVDRATFGLSGGEMRRVALAGALALKPKLLVLDEATTGLDPEGRNRAHALLRRLAANENLTVLIVSNDMDEVAELADAVTVLNDGRTVASGSPPEVFADGALLAACSLVPPTSVALTRQLAEQDLALGPLPLTAGEAEEALWRALSH